MAVRLVEGGLQSYDPKAAASTIKTGTVISGRKRTAAQRSGQAVRDAAIKAREAVERANKQARDKRLAQEKLAADRLRQEIIIARRTNNKSLEASKAVELRESLTRQAQLRGRAFTQSEARKFLGGGAGVKSLKIGARTERILFKKTGISLSQERAKVASNIEILKGITVSKIVAESMRSDVPGFVRIRLPNGKIEEVRSSGRVNISSSIGGQKVVVNNGKVISVGVDDVNRVRTGTFDVYTKGDILKSKLKRIVKPIGDDAATKARLEQQQRRLIQKQRAFQNSPSVASILAMPKGSARRNVALKRDKAELAYMSAIVSVGILTFATAATLGAKKIPSGAAFLVKNRAEIKKFPGFVSAGVKELIKNPSLIGKGIVKVEGFARDQLKSYIQDVGVVWKISPSSAVVKVSTDWYLLKLTNKGFNIVGKVGSSATGTLRTITRSGRTAIRVRAGAKVVTQKSISIDYAKSLKAARKIRANTRKRYTTIRPNTPDFQKAIAISERSTEIMAEVKAKQFVLNQIKNGARLTRKQADDFVKAAKVAADNLLKNDPTFKRLIKLDELSRNNAIKLIRNKKILPARAYAKMLVGKIDKYQLGRKMNDLMRKVKSGIKVRTSKAGVVKHKVQKKVKGVKHKIDTSKVRRKSAQQYKKELARARIRRGKMRKKFNVINVGNSNYIEGVVFIEDYAKLISAQRARNIVKEFAKRGVKLTKTQQEKIIALSRKQADNFLKNSNMYKQLQNAAKLNRPSTIKLQKVGSIRLARSYVKSLQTSIRNIKGMRQLRDVVRGVKRKTSPTRIKKTIARKKSIKASQKRFRQTNRYRMEKNRPIREVTVDRLKRTNTVTNMNKLVDDLFNEISRRRRVDITSLQFRQSKNILKKRLRKAINSGNRKDIESFRNWARKTIRDLDSPKKQPAVRVVETTGAKKTRVIKNFKPESPKGTYKEVKVGNQIQLQKVEIKAMQKGQRAVQKTIQKQKLVVRSVSKQTLSMKPLAKVIASSIGVQLSKTISASAVKSGNAQNFISKMDQESRQDFNTITKIDTAVKSTVAQAILSAQISKTRTGIKTVSKQIADKKKVPVRVKLPSGFTIRRLSKVVPTYRIVVKKRGKNVAKLPRELTKNDARDYLAYEIDNTLSRSGSIVPTGKKKIVARIPRNMVGYYSKTSRKLRPYKIRMGKKKQLLDGYIEKSKHFQDTKREVAQASRLRAKKKVVKRKPSKRTPQKKKVTRRAPARRSPPTKKRQAKRKVVEKQTTKKKKR